METTDGRYIKILEIEPINFMLRSSEEQFNILSCFASWLKISPMKLQFKSITRKADSDKHIAMLRQEMAAEDNEQCKTLSEDYIRLIKDVGSREALTRRFFLIYQYEAIGRNESDDYAKIYGMLMTAEQNARAYFLQCGNNILQPKNPDVATAEILYMFFNRRSCVDEPFSDRANRVVVDAMAAKNRVIGVDPVPHIPITHFIAPRGLDLTHHNFIIMDGRYYGYAVKGVEFTYLKVAEIVQFTESEKDGVTYNHVEVLYGIDKNIGADLLNTLGLPKGAERYTNADHLDSTKYFYQSDVLIDALELALQTNSTNVKNALERYIAANGGTAMPLTDSYGKSQANDLDLGLYLCIETKISSFLIIWVLLHSDFLFQHSNVAGVLNLVQI